MVAPVVLQGPDAYLPTYRIHRSLARRRYYGLESPVLLILISILRKGEAQHLAEFVIWRRVFVSG